jgi:hypothetical protein
LQRTSSEKDTPLERCFCLLVLLLLLVVTAAGLQFMVVLLRNYGNTPNNERFCTEEPTIAHSLSIPSPRAKIKKNQEIKKSRNQNFSFGVVAVEVDIIIVTPLL